MKKLTTITLFITMAVFSYGQSQRLVLLEHFTQASCGPCASANPIIHTLLVNNPDKITSINYHTSWPGYDPMYNHNTADAAAKTSYYGVSSVPNSVLDGNYYNGHPSYWNINTVNARYAVPSPFNLAINQTLSTGNDTLFITMLVEATATVTGPISAYMSVIEKHIHFNSAPGSNGEKDFYNVMKKLLPTNTGLALQTPMQAGDYVILESFWVLANVYNLTELSVVGFVQNPSTKEIHQSANLSVQPMTAIYTNDAELVGFTNLADKMCNTSFSPRVKIRNNGNAPMTSLDINYQVNGGELQTYHWNGDLPFLSNAEIELPQVSFDLLENNQLQAYIAEINQVSDEYPANDTLMHYFVPALLATRDILLKIRTDNFPQEVTWEIKNSNGDVVIAGGPYSNPNVIHNEEIALEADGCYEFFIYDAGGNGLCCNNGNGFYRLTSESVTLATGTQFGALNSEQFEVLSVGVNKLPLNSSFEIYPNPASSQLFLEFTPEQSRTVKVNIFNQLGQSVWSTAIATASGVTQKTEINTQNWPAGIYMVRFDDGTSISSRKVSIGN